MNENIKNYIKLSEKINNNLIDNIFELNIPKSNFTSDINKSKQVNNNEYSDMSLNISNMEISKLIQMFRMNKKAFRDFFKFKIFKFRPAQELITIILEFTKNFDNEMFHNIFSFALEEKNLVIDIKLKFIN